MRKKMFRTDDSQVCDSLALKQLEKLGDQLIILKQEFFVYIFTLESLEIITSANDCQLPR